MSKRLYWLLFVLLPLSAPAYEDRQATIIVENVTIPDRDNAENDSLVNIIVRDGNIDLITQDGLPDEPGVPSFDAEAGILLGNVEIGSKAGFLILGADPREDIQVLLDTRTYAIFAMAHGAVERNRLPAITDRPKRQQGWFSYTPPPIALPTRYDSRQKWNYYESDTWRNLFTVGLVLDRTRWESQDSVNRMQVGDLEEFDGGEIRGLRFGVVGAFQAFDRPWTYTIFGATSAFDKGFDTDEDDDFLWFDYRLDVPVFQNNTISIGKQKEPINLERTTSLIFLPFQERSAPADTFLPSRNVGIVMSGNQFNDRMSWATGIFNDWLDSGGSRSDGAQQFVGRVTGIPIATRDESNLLHLGFGYRYSDVEEGATGAATPEANQAPDFLDTGFIAEADSSQIFNYELSWRKGPWWIHGEYIDTSLEDTPFGDLDFSGYHLSASWALTGEMRNYNRKSGIFDGISIARPVNHNGWGAWEVGLRYSHTDLNDGLVQGGEMNIWTLGLNWWMRQDMQASVNWRWVELDRPVDQMLAPVTGDATGWTSRIVLLLD